MNAPHQDPAWHTTASAVLVLLMCAALLGFAYCTRRDSTPVRFATLVLVGLVLGLVILMVL